MHTQDAKSCEKSHLPTRSKDLFPNTSDKAKLDRKSKIELIKEQIEEGSYEIDAKKIAVSMMKLRQKNP